MQTLTVPNSSPFIVGQQSKKVQNPDSIEAMTPEKDKMVSGVFKNLECPGQPGFVGCRLYRGQNYWQKWFHDGEEATIPLSIARHINTNTKYPIHSFILDEKGNYIKGTGQMRQRYEFVSKEFL